MENINIKCTACKHYKNANEFKKNGKFLKQCIKCRMNKLKSYTKNKCLHNLQKSQCVKCHGSCICEHKKRKDHCKHCGDEIKITIKIMICGSKKNDKKCNRFDNTNFIDKSFLKKLIEDSENKCYYCKCKLQYMIKQSNLATIERIDNKLGHNKNNVVIACFHCNVSKVGDKLN